MPRDLVVGNGNLLICFDRGLNMRDLYYPYVGQWNHIGGNKNSLGVWADGHFSWTDESAWQSSLGYLPETLVTHVKTTNHALGLTLHINDTVHYCDNLYIKKIVVENLWEANREVRLFFNHDFSIDESEVADTAVFDPELRTVYHYKRNRYFMANGICNGKGIYQYATGTKRFRGAEGTWRDAEDGHLQGNPIAQGSVDSTISFLCHLPPRGSLTVFYWLAVGKNYQEVRDLNQRILQGPEQALQSTISYWRAWVNKIPKDFGNLPQEVVDLYKRSILVVKSQIDRGGAILAATDSDILLSHRDHYGYVWPRDGALVAQAMVLAGYTETAKSFFNFCNNAISAKGFFLHKYNPDGSAGSSWHPWIADGKSQLPIQEDETGLVLWALWEYYRYSKDLEYIQRVYRSLVVPTADFMVRYFRPDLGLTEPSYDLWEERRGVFAFTAAAVYGGLMAAASFAQLFADERETTYRKTAAALKEGISRHLYDPNLGRFVRGIYLEKDGGYRRDFTLESSLFGLFRFGVLEPTDPRIISTMEAVEKGLWINTSVGGIARYTNDYYFQISDDIRNVPGNPWFVCTFWLAEWLIARAQTVEELKKPLELFRWACRHALPSGILSEQINPYNGEPVSVAPLTWSHAGYVGAVSRYLVKYKELVSG